MPAKPIDRADRQVELAADHQERHRRREDAELGGDLEDVEMPARAEQAGIAGEDGEDEDDEDGAGQRAELGPADQLGEAGGRPQPIVYCNRHRAIVRWLRSGTIAACAIARADETSAVCREKRRRPAIAAGAAVTA